MTASDTSIDPSAPEENAADEPVKLTLSVDVEKPSACERHISVSIAREDVDRYLSEAVDELMPKAEVPGFRHGKAPRKLVENKFRKEVANQVKGSLIMDAISQVTEEEDLSAISEPDFDYEAVQVPEEGPMTFEFNLEVRPDFDMPQWKGLKIDKPVRDYGPEDVDAHLQKLLRKHAEMVEKDGPIAAGDYATIDVTFTKDGETVSEMLDETVCVLPTLSFFDGNIEKFDKLLKGAKVGDTKDTKVKVSSDSLNEDLRDEEVTASVKINEVLEMELPELDGPMLERLGNFDNEGDMRDAVKEHLDRQLKYHQNQQVRDQISALLIESADWALPPDLLKRQSQRELHRAVMELRSSGFSDEEIQAHENQLRQNSQQSTAKALKEHFILERIAEMEEVDADPSDYDTEIAMIAAQSGDNPRRVRARLEKQDLMDTLRNQIIERKVIELIQAEAEFNEVKYSPEENDVEAVEHFIAGEPEADIPEAKHDEGDVPKQPVDHT